MQVLQAVKIVLNLILPSISLGNNFGFARTANLIAQILLSWLEKIWNDSKFKREVQERPDFVHPFA